MNKQLFFVCAAATAALVACQSSQVKITGRFAGSDAKNIYLEQVTPLRQQIIDSALLDTGGNYRFRLKGAGRTPALYNLVYGGERIPLLLKGGEHLSLNALGNVLRNYTVAGSAESELLRQFYQPFVTGARQLDLIASRFAREGMSEEQRRELSREYADEYYRIRREQLRFIVEHKASLAAVYALYQRLPGDTDLAGGDNDAVYFRTVAEAIEKSYPESPYLAALRGDIARMDARRNLASQITETNYPDLDLTDMYGKKVRLSSLAGKVILLDFWSAEAGTSNANNADLKEIYAAYSDAPTPLEVYQVAIDTDKARWITAVQEQGLPWISVSDLRGAQSPVVGLYNLRKIPANFLIASDGTIAAKNLYGHDLDKKLSELTR